MDTAKARNIAHYSHLDRRDRFDEPVIEHVERVAAAVPEDARTVAFLHDVLEHTQTTLDDVLSQGVTPTEFAALELLTRSPEESFESHVLRIAHAPGAPGELARTVKLADLDDHLARSSLPSGAPPYGWARLHIVAAQERTVRRAAA